MTKNTQQMLIDFHCHLDLYSDYESVLERTEMAQIYTLTMTTTPRAWKRNFALTHTKKYIRAALGLHPQVVDKCFEELSLWKHYLCETRYVGEVGLDASQRYYKSFDKQKYIFRNILEHCAAEGGKILSVHSTKCASTVLDMIEQYYQTDNGTIVLHWFSGNKYDMQRALSLGCYFSINSEMVKSNNGRNIISKLPLTHILTETDGPFVKINGKSVEPTDIPSIINSISQIKKENYDIIKSNIHRNFLAILE